MASSHHVFRERQWLGVVGWVCIVGFAVSLGVAYGAATSGAVGIATSAVCLAGSSALTFRAATRIHVTATEIEVGAARIELQHIGDAHALSPDRLRALRRERVSSQGWWAVPAWMTHAVVFPVTDESDPHSFWVVGTRRPEQLLTAIGQAQRIREAMPPLRHG